jgi:hypothetical protein
MLTSNTLAVVHALPIRHHMYMRNVVASPRLACTPLRLLLHIVLPTTAGGRCVDGWPCGSCLWWCGRGAWRPAVSSAGRIVVGWLPPPSMQARAVSTLLLLPMVARLVLVPGVLLMRLSMLRLVVSLLLVLAVLVLLQLALPGAVGVAARRALCAAAWAAPRALP